MIALRFGMVPPTVRESLRNASPAELERWSERILLVSTLDELLPAE
jgi:hypothetical protein